MTFDPSSFPTNLYPWEENHPHPIVLRLFCELASLICASLLAYPIYMQCTKPKEGVGVVPAARGIPLHKTGQPYLRTAVILWSLYTLNVLLWVYMFYQSTHLPEFGSDYNSILFQDPSTLQGTASAPPSPPWKVESSNYMENLREVHRIFAEYKLQCDGLERLYVLYSVLNGLLVCVMLQRFFEYLAFQKRLSIVTDTFMGISGDLFHLTIVFVFVVVCFSFLSSFLFGYQDFAFTNIWEGILLLFAACFGLFKPAGTSTWKSAAHFHFNGHLDDNSWATFDFPMVMFVLFKFIAITLLFKFIIVALMDSYKKHTANKHNAKSVEIELYHLLTYWFRKHVRFAWFNHPFMTFEDVARGIRAYEESTPYGERQRFLDAASLLDWVRLVQQRRLDTNKIGTREFHDYSLEDAQYICYHYGIKYLRCVSET